MVAAHGPDLLHRRRYRPAPLDFWYFPLRIVVRRRRPAHAALVASLGLPFLPLPSISLFAPLPAPLVALRRLRVQLALRHQHITHLPSISTYLLRCRQLVLLSFLIRYRTQRLVRIRRILFNPVTSCC